MDRQAGTPHVRVAVGLGGNRALWVLRVSLEGTGAILYPEMFSLSIAHQAFDEAGALKEAKLAARLEKNVNAFLTVARAIATTRAPA